MTERTAGRRALPLLMIIILVAGAGIGYFLNRFVNTTEVRIEAVDSQGDVPFMPVVAAQVVPQRPVHAIGHVVTGDAVGLYGGSGTSTCDAAAIQDFLETHAGPAQAWAGALRISTNDIGRYLGTLTPLTLRT